MSLLKRVKNLWAISKFSQEDYVSYVEGVVIPAQKVIGTKFEPAVIIKLKKDPVDEILKNG